MIIMHQCAKNLLYEKKCSTKLLEIYNTLLIHYLYLYYCSVNVFITFLNVFYFSHVFTFLTFFYFFPTFFTSMLSIGTKIGDLE